MIIEYVLYRYNRYTVIQSFIKKDSTQNLNKSLVNDVP